jgi:uncharacterized membrane protein YhaH (DUF805 family)
VNYYLQALSRKYTDFSSRSRRSEFWFFTLFSTLAAVILTMVDMAIGTFDYETESGLLANIYLLLVFIPTYAVTVRRLHDIGKSGWAILKIFGGQFLALIFMFTAFAYVDENYPHVSEEEMAQMPAFLGAGIMIIIIIALTILALVWLCTDSQPGHNRFGENPKNDSRLAGSSKYNNYTYEQFKPSSENTSSLDALERLAVLHKEGRLSDEEFEREKKNFLN